ncbi:MAG: glycosyltransferase family 4 protein, partial [Candidatus Rokuibacteriota bacterium]
LALAALARRVAAAGVWDVVQTHERALGAHVYRAGEGCHRAYLAARDGEPGRGLYHRVVLALERRVFARTPRIVAIARAGRREIEALYGVPPARVAVVYNGVDLARFHPGLRETLRQPARAEAGVPAGAFAALFVGSGFERKGLATALEAVAGLDDRSAQLIVVGKGREAPYHTLATRLGVADRVRWLGPRADVERWYAAADACVLPSRYEPFGNVHLEALACGLPVVASTAAGGSEIVAEAAAGRVVDPRDPRAVSAALTEMQDAARTRPVAVATAARRAAEPYTYAAQVAGFRHVWANLG